MAHSKRNTSLAFFTSYERSLLKSEYGTLRTRLTRDSFKTIDACNLCLHRARDPVACEHGDVFCRECAVENLLAQRREIERTEKENEKRAQEEEEERRREEEKARERVVREFEMTQMGLERKGGNGGGGGGNGDRGMEKGGEETRVKKRKFELDEEELGRIVRDETEKAKKAMRDDKAASKNHMPAFWHPSQTPTTAPAAAKPVKLVPTCPASDLDNPHGFSLKDLIPLQFSESKDEKTSQGLAARICPACNKALSNARKACFCAPCGHVLCKPCVDDFMLGGKVKDDPHATKKKGRLRCYVCDEAVEAREKDKENGGKKKKFRGIVTITSDGTGFAGGGGNMVEKRGTAFLV